MAARSTGSRGHRSGAYRTAPLLPLPVRRSRSRAPTRMSNPRTLVEKIWDDHVVTQDEGAPAVLAVDLHLVHEVTSPQAFTGLRTRGLTVRRPDKTVATADHGTPTTPAACRSSTCRRRRRSPSSRRTAATSASRSTRSAATPRASSTSSARSSGCTQPGMTIVCGDSHTATHGAFGALAFGIGTSEVEMVLATQTLLQRQPKTYEVRVDGRLTAGVSAKDIILRAHRPDRDRRRHRARVRVPGRGRSARSTWSSG